MEVSPRSSLAVSYAYSDSAAPRAQTGTPGDAIPAVSIAYQNTRPGTPPLIGPYLPPRTQPRNWKLYAIGGVTFVAASLAFGLGFGLAARHGHAGAAAATTGAGTPIPTISATTSARPTTTASATPVPTASLLQDPSFEPLPSEGDAHQDVGSWQPWDVALFPAGIPTAGDAAAEGVPNSEAAGIFQGLALQYPEYLASLVQQRPNDTFQVSMVDPQGQHIAVQVDNKFLTANNGSLLQLGSAGHRPTWATVLEKGLAKWSAAFTPSNERHDYYGLSNVTGDEVLRAYAPAASRAPNGTLVIPGVSATDPKLATQSAVSALTNTFSALPADTGRAAAFNRAVGAALAGDAATLEQAIGDLTSNIEAAKLGNVAAYDNVVSGLKGVLAWVKA